MSQSVEFDVRVVGVTFLRDNPNGAPYPEAFHALRDTLEARQAESVRKMLDEPRPVEALLIRRPDNPYDANAIEVHVPDLGRRSMVGHVPRDLAKRLARRIDSGEYEITAKVAFVAVLPENPDQPGLDITVTATPAAKN